MAKSAQLNFTQNINNNYAEFVNGDGASTANRQTLFTAGANDSILKGIIVTSDDTSDMTLVVEYYDGTSYIPLFRETILDGAGTNGTDPAQEVLTIDNLPILQADNNSNYSLSVKTGHTITGYIAGTVTADKTVRVLSIGEDY